MWTPQNRRAPHYYPIHITPYAKPTVQSQGKCHHLRNTYLLHRQHYYIFTPTPPGKHLPYDYLSHLAFECITTTRTIWNVLYRTMEMEQELIQTIILFIVLIVVLLIAVVLMYQKYINNILTKERKLKQVEVEHKEQLLSHTIEAGEKERKAIAEDLHDNLTARLNILRLHLYDEYEVKQENRLLQDLDSCIELSRNISHKLKSPILEKFGLLPAIKDLLDALHQSYVVDIYELADTNSVRLSAKQELHVYRIAQEVVVNIIKHSNASAIEVYWRNTAKLFALTIRDNGRGIHQSSIPGIGTSNIMARAEYLQAIAKIRAIKPSGTSVTIIIPK